VFRTLIVLAGLSAAAANSVAQTPTNSSTKLAFVIPQLFGPDGLTLPNPTHKAHFDSDFQANFGPFNTALGSQLTSLPLPSPASGFTYTFDPALGVYTRSAQSYGPVLAERAETIGKEKFFAGFSFQHFRFGTLDGVSLHNFNSVFRHAQTTPDPIIKEDLITTDTFLDTKIDQATVFFTYGLTDRIDVSVALPFVNANLAVQSKATIQRIGTGSDTTIHYFLDANGNSTDHKTFANSGSASGLGDVLVRLKGTALKTKPAWIALGLDVRLPTGDAYNFLGSGAVGLKPFLAISGRTKRVTPHVNAGYQWNDSSPLAGDIFSGTSGHLPNQFEYAVGFDAGVNKRFSFAGDVLGQVVFHAQGVAPATFTAANGLKFADNNFVRENINITNGSVGFKVNPIGTLLVSFNALIQLNDAGLRARVVPLVGFSYTF
jgi:hypothetical protein